LRSRVFRLDQRSAGILLHPTSLPGRLGSGDLGAAAYRFVEFCSSAGLRWWQMLPVGPIGPGNSPYSSTSAFAGNPLLINLDRLVDEGLLHRRDLRQTARMSSDRVRYADVARFRMAALRRAYLEYSSRVVARGDSSKRASDAAWLPDYTLFCALRERFRAAPWNTWPTPLRGRSSAALVRARRELEQPIRFHGFVQALFARDWASLRAYAHANGVALMGDIPIFVSHDSADVWANPHLYQLDRSGRAKQVSGCPPDSFSATGQLWGHPQYDWPAHQRSGFRWWIDRFAAAFERFDAVRIDHFLGFHQVWSVPGGAKTAEHGRYVKSPGRELFTIVRRSLGKLEIVAEDLGAVVPEARALRDQCGFPGMRILQNAWWEGARYDQPHNYPRNCVAYTGTHDNETFTGWFRGLPSDRGRDGLTTRERTIRYIDGDSRSIHEAATRALYASAANVAIVPAQDVLGLGNEARMNIPATASGNWEWRMRPGALRDRHARWLHDLADTYERIPK
jgi:4-alpha-glucanotransferase